MPTQRDYDAGVTHPDPIHLRPGGILDDHHPALCGWQPVAGVQMIPVRHWNGKREGVCEECVRTALELLRNETTDAMLVTGG